LVTVPGTVKTPQRAETAPGKPRAARPKPQGPGPLERVEKEIAAQEQIVATLERQLADDWGNAELLAAHTAARDELRGLLERWEALFEEAQAPEVGSPG
jgi:uncharacterized coiled-coil protein SlyX